jgi:hypothetical protein
MRRPCWDCPWARRATRGWLGPLTADEWLELAHGEGFAECHTTTIDAACAGLAIYRANVAKVVRDAGALRLPPDRQRVFDGPEQFRVHHGPEA